MQQRITETLIEYWQALKPANALPAESDIDPDALGEIWDHCFLARAEKTEKSPIDKNFRYLYMGSAIIEAYGDDLTGQEVCEKLVGGLNDPLVDKFEQVLKSGQILQDESEFINHNKLEIRYRSCMLPLQNAQGQAEFILGGMKWKAF